VNFVLRKNFKGVEASTQYGVSEEGDAKRYRSDLTIGAGFDDGTEGQSHTYDPETREYVVCQHCDGDGYEPAR
jgi:hypothetical protein